MMNAVALFLLLSSLVTAGVWSPPPENQHPNPSTLLQEEDTPKENKLSSSSTHDVTKGTSSAEVDQNFQRKLKQALEKCRNKAREVIEEPPDAKEKGGVFEALTKAKETLSQEAQEAKDKVSEKAQQVKDTVGDVTQKAKEKVSEKAQVVKDTVGDATQKVKEKVTEKPQINVQEEEEAAAREEGGSEAVEQQAAESTANDVMEGGGGGEKDLSEILRRGRELGYDVLVYVVLPRAVEPAVGVVHLLGFAAAYGMCLWVTFVSSYVLGGALSRQQFGVVQSKIYPVYFRTMAYCDLFSITGSIYLLIQIFGIGNCSSVIPFIATERSVVYRERFAGMYSSWAYAFAQVTIEIPYVFLQAVIFTIITYPAIGFYLSINKVFWYTCTMFCTMLYFTYLGMLLVALTPNIQVASILASFCYNIMNLFSGFLIPQPNIPKWWIWFYWICPAAWSQQGFVTSQYGDIEKEIIVFGEQKAISAFLKSYYGYHHHLLGVVASVLVAFPLIFATGFAYAIAKLNFQRR